MARTPSREQGSRQVFKGEFCLLVYPICQVSRIGTRALDLGSIVGAASMFEESLLDREIVQRCQKRHIIKRGCARRPTQIVPYKFLPVLKQRQAELLVTVAIPSAFERMCDNAANCRLVAGKRGSISNQRAGQVGCRRGEDRQGDEASRRSARQTSGVIPRKQVRKLAVAKEEFRMVNSTQHTLRQIKDRGNEHSERRAVGRRHWKAGAAQDEAS